VQSRQLAAEDSKAATLADFAMPEDELVANLSRFNPVDNLQGLLAQKVPMFIVHGDAMSSCLMTTIPACSRNANEAGAGEITVKLIPGEGHKVSPSFFECQELIDFVLAKSGASK